MIDFNKPGVYERKTYGRARGILLMPDGTLRELTDEELKSLDGGKIARHLANSIKEWKELKR